MMAMRVISRIATRIAAPSAVDEAFSAATALGAAALGSRAACTNPHPLFAPPARRRLFFPGNRGVGREPILAAPEGAVCRTIQNQI